MAKKKPQHSRTLTAEYPNAMLSTREMVSTHTVPGNPGLMYHKRAEERQADRDSVVNVRNAWPEREGDIALPAEPAAPRAKRKKTARGKR